MRTHCPYCAFQCGMLVGVSPDGRLTIEGDREFPVNAGALCVKGWTAAETLYHDERAHDRSCATPPGNWCRPTGDGCRRGRRGNPDDHAATARRGRRVRRRLAHQREGLPARQVRARRARHREHRLQRPLLHVLGGRGRDEARSASIAACPFPLDDIAGAEVILLIGANVAETMPPMMRYFDAQRHGDGALIVVDPRRTATAQRADAAPAARARLRRRARQRPAAHPHARAPDRRGLHPAAHRGLRRASRRSSPRYWPERVERITGVPEADLIGRGAHARRCRRRAWC